MRKQIVTIVKIQLSLLSGPKTMLINNKRRDIQYENIATPEIISSLKGKTKGYFQATINDQNQLVIGKRVANRTDW